MSKNNITRALPQSSAQWWSLALACTGFGLLCVMAWCEAEYALAISANERDAVLKIGFSLAFSIAAFGGGIVTSAKLADPRVGVRKGANLAQIVTAVCFCVAAVNFASYVAFARAEKAAAAVRLTEPYRVAKRDYATLQSDARAAAADYTANGAAGEALAEATAVLAAGERPRAVVWFAERKAGEVTVQWYDLLLAALSGATVIGLGAAYRMPGPPARQRRKAKAEPAVNVTKLRA